MPTWTLDHIKRQFEQAERGGWLAYFEEAAALHQFDSATLMGIASRETNMRSILGDGGHGHGIMQIDDRSYPAFCAGKDWKDPRLNILKGAEVLSDKRTRIRDGFGARLEFRRGKKKIMYVGVTLTSNGLLRTAIAAYNSGDRAYYFVSTSGNPDEGTTGHDYSCDVVNRTEAFTRLLPSHVS